MSDHKPISDPAVWHGRGSRSNRAGRFETEIREDFDDGWDQPGDLEALKTQVVIEPAKSIISRNESPDISFEQSINPYRGCEHGCIYCYARPTHCYLGHSAGLDFETKLYAKTNAAEVLEKELSAHRYVPKVIALGAVTDPYQPIEREHRITRSILEVLERTSHPVGIVTKSALVMRDIDILERMAAKSLVKVAISVTTLDRVVARKMEPRAATPQRRLDAIKTLAATEGISMNQFLVMAASEKLTAMRTAEEFFTGRKGRGDQAGAIRFLTRADGEASRAGDEG